MSSVFVSTPFEQRLAFLVKLASEDGAVRALAPSRSREPGMAFQEEVPFGLLLAALQEGVIVKREGPEYRVHRLRFFFRSSFGRLKRNVDALLSSLITGGDADVLSQPVCLERFVVRSFNWVDGLVQGEMVERGLVVFGAACEMPSSRELDEQLRLAAGGSAQGDIILVCHLAPDEAPVQASGGSLRACLDALSAN